MSEPTARHRLIRLASILPKESEERAEVLSVLAKKELPEELKKHQFTEEDNPNPKGSDKDGDGKTNEKKPFTEGKKAAPCDDAPAPLKEQCLKKVEEGKKNDDKDSDKKATETVEAKESYPWPECIKDQMKEYGSKEIAEKVCGKIKAESQGRSASEVTLRNGLIRMAFALPKGSGDRKKILEVLQG